MLIYRRPFHLYRKGAGEPDPLKLLSLRLVRRVGQDENVILNQGNIRQSLPRPLERALAPAVNDLKIVSGSLHNPADRGRDHPLHTREIGRAHV